MLYRAQNEWWVSCLVFVAGVALAVAGVWLVYTGLDVGSAPGMWVVTMKTTPFMLLLGALMPPFGVLLIWCLAATRYEISLRNLIVESGPSQRRIPLDSIVAARITSSGLLRGPIWSRQVVRIDLRRGKGRGAAIVISPREPVAFLQTLSQAAPMLRQQADGSLQAK